MQEKIIHWLAVKTVNSGYRVTRVAKPRYRHKQLPSNQISRSLPEASVRLLYYSSYKSCYLSTQNYANFFQEIFHKNNQTMHLYCFSEKKKY